MKLYLKFLLAILVLAALVVVVLAFTSFPWWLTKIESARIGGSIGAEKQLEAVEAVQNRLLTIAAGIGGLATLLFAGLTLEETRKLNLVNRYSSATEKLGAEATAGRVAAIYALEHSLESTVKGIMLRLWTYSPRSFALTPAKKSQQISRNEK